MSRFLSCAEQPWISLINAAPVINAAIEVIMSYNLFRGGADSARKREYYNLYYAAIEERKQAYLHVRQKVMNDFNNLAALQQQLVLTNISRLAQASRLANIVTASAATTMRENPEVRAIVEGHTDSTGATEYNQVLSERRAQAVRDLLVNRYGVNPAQLKAIGRGESMPVADNGNECRGSQPQPPG